MINHIVVMHKSAKNNHSKTSKDDALRLDFCRVKKIFDKGYGFLTSLYFNENVFFHFSKIEDSRIRLALSEMKRGSVSLFYISELHNEKRRVKKVWTEINRVPEKYLRDFIKRLLLALNDGEQNPFEIINALAQLRSANNLTANDISEIINSKKSKRNPTILLKLLENDESEKSSQLQTIIEESKNNGQLNLEKIQNILM